MPFTPTHVLAIVPVASASRGRLPFSALAIGSMIPDLALFAAWSPSYQTMHAPWGLLTACLPLGLAGFYVYQTVMKRPLLALLPRAIQGRCAALAAPRVRPFGSTLALAAAAVLIGAATHAVWDSFTHSARWGTTLIPALNEPALRIGSQVFPGYKVFQYGSTVVGLPGMALIGARWLARREALPADRAGALPSWMKRLAWVATVAIPVAISLWVGQRNELTRYERLGQAITTTGSTLLLVFLAYCLAFHVWRTRARIEETGVSAAPTGSVN